MKTGRLLVMLIFCLWFLAACSANVQEEKSALSNSGENAADSASSNEMKTISNETASDKKEKSPLPSVNQKIIYTAELQIEVEDLKKANRLLDEKLKAYNGYIVQSNTYRNGDETYSSTLTLRIPENSFEKFLADAEEIAVKVHQRNVSGSDVSEEYTDLESRLKSKKAVETRLLEFMQKAATTEDLLKISSDLARVQEEIEQITGRIKYLENQVDFSTIIITINENNINVPELTNKDLNTWEKIKKQFMTSINLLLAGLSGGAVFLFGNLPILLLAGLAAGAIIFLIRRRKRKE